MVLPLDLLGPGVVTDKAVTNPNFSLLLLLCPNTHNITFTISSMGLDTVTWLCGHGHRVPQTRFHLVKLRRLNANPHCPSPGPWPPAFSFPSL